MKNAIDMSEKLLRLSNDVGGVFALSEISSLFDISDTQKLRNAIKRFEEAKLLNRYCRGVYTTRNYDPLILSVKVRPESYVSLGSALAIHRLIGTESPRLVSCVTQAKAADFKGDVNLSYSKINEELCFGYDISSTGVKIADPEKAVLDTLYFYQHGKIYHFNIFQDIAFQLLSKEKLESYLNRFNNPKFQAFARKVVYGNV